MRRRADALWRSAPGFLALTREGQDVLVIQGPAADLWELLTEETSLDELVHTLESRYHSSGSEVRAGLEELVEVLREQGYIEDREDA